MIREALRKLYSVYFRPRATSVSPENLLDGDIEQIVGRMIERGLIQGMGPNAIEPIPPGPYVDPRQRGAEPEPEPIGSTTLHISELRISDAPPRPGIKPPPDPATEGWIWTAWKRELDAGALPGWAVCRFANRIGPDHVAFVFGIVRGSFGIWRQPFDVCAAGTDSTEHILTCVTHLRSGLGIGIFSDRAVAAEAAELAERVCPAWATLDPADHAAWAEVHNRTGVAWLGIGVRYLDDAHCHDKAGGTYGIYSRTAESMMAGRPEKLS